MSSQNSFLGQFGQSSRAVPAPIQSEAPGLSVPTNVPYVAPPNVIPDNLPDMARYSQLNQLARALGTGGVGASGLANSIMRIAAQRREQANNTNYHQGLVDATTRAAQTRDIYSDVSKNGLIPPNKNPYYVLGYQTLLSQELASSYRAELVQARAANPTLSPQELQDQIKQKYLPLMQGARPDMLAKFFIEPSMAADKDDNTLFEKTRGEQFKQKMDSAPSNAVGALFQSEMTLIKEGSSTVPLLQQKLVKTIENSLQTSYATGWDYTKQVENILEQVESNAALLTDKAGNPASLKERQALLDTLKMVKLPTGNPLLSEGDFIKKFKEARERLVTEAYQQDKLAGEALDGVIKQNTQSYRDMMVEDLKNGKLTDFSSYVKKIPKGQAVDVDGLGSFYSKLKGNTETTEEAEENDTERQMWVDTHVNNMSAGELNNKYGSLVPLGIVDGNKLGTAMSVANNNQRRKQEDAKLPAFPVGEANVYLKQIRAPITQRHSAGRWTGYGKDGVLTGVTNDLQAVYSREFRRRYFQKAKENPQAAQDPAVRQDWMDQIWRGLQGPLQEDYQRIQNQTGPYSRILNRFELPGTSTTRVYQKNNSPSRPNSASTQHKNPQTPSAFSNQFPWAVNQQSFQQENNLFKQRKGKAYQWLQSSAGPQVEYHWRRYLKQNPDQPVMGIVEFLKSKGKPTFLNMNNNNKQPGQQPRR